MTEDDALLADLRELKIRHLARKWVIPREEAAILLDNMEVDGDE